MKKFQRKTSSTKGYAKADRALLKDLRKLSKNKLISDSDLLKTYFVWRCRCFRSFHVPSMRLLKRWVRRVDPSLYRYVEDISQSRSWIDIDNKMSTVAQNLRKSGYIFPKGSVPLYHKAMPSALVEMRLIGALAAIRNVELDFNPLPDASTSGGESGSGSASARVKADSDNSVDDSDPDRIFIVPISALNPPSIFPKLPF